MISSTSAGEGLRRVGDGRPPRVGNYVQWDGVAAIPMNLAGLPDGTDEITWDTIASPKGLKPP